MSKILDNTNLGYFISKIMATFIKKTDTIPASSVDLSGVESTSNKVTSLSVQSTDTQYPSAKAVVDYVDEQSPVGNDEDINQNTSGKLQFANRVYNAQQPNGMGYKIIRKDATFASQVTDTNTIYEIRYDFDLNGGTVNILENCILKFNGGSISNGTLNGDSTKISAGLVKIFGASLTFTGSFVLEKVFPEWFGAVGLYYQSSNEATQPTGTVIPQAADNLADAGPMLNRAFGLAQLSTGVVFMQRQIYRIETKVVIPSKCTLQTQEDTVFDVRMSGSGAKKIVQSPETSEFGSETPFDSLSLYPNEFFAPTSMAVAFEIGSVKTALIGRGVITLLNSKYTIGILVPGTGFQYLDMSYESPYIDIRTVGGPIGTIAPDNRDLYGDTDPSSSIGENGQYYWNTIDKTYWKKENGAWTEQWSNNPKGSLFNVSLRIDVGSGWNSGRVIRPKIKLWDMGGWRGIEIYTHNGGWCNDGWWEGSVSNKHGSFISLFTNYDISFHNFEQVTCQVDAYLQNDCSIFYAIRAGRIIGPRTWDLQWAQPQRANSGQQNLDSAILYFGRFVSYSRIYLDGGNLKYFVDYGRNNETTVYGSNVSCESHPWIVAASGYINLFKYRTPDIAARTFNLKHYKQITTLYQNVADLIAGEIGSTNSVQAPTSLFDEDENTFESLIDCDNSIYGTVILIGKNNTAFDSGTGIKDNRAFLELFYRHIGYNSTLDKKVFAVLYCSNPSNSSSSIRQLNSVNSVNYLSEIFYTGFYGSANYYLILFTTASVSGYKLNVSSICYWVKNLLNDANGLSGKMYGKTQQKINAPAPGAMYYDTDLGLPLINLGTSSQPNWQIINAGALPMARFVNVSPGQEMTWKDLNGNVSSSIQAVVETPNVKPLEQRLFENNRTLKEISYYPIVTTPPSSCVRVFGGCSYLEVLPFLNLSGAANATQMFADCLALKEIPKYDMSTITVVEKIFFNCRALETIPLLNWQSVTNAAQAFYRCYALKNVGGFASCAVSLDMTDCANLTRDSALNIFNNLATVETTQTITLHATVYALLSASDITIATNKGWSVVSA